MPVATLKAFLDANGVPYETVVHDRTFTAQQTAESTHIPGSHLAKTVMVKLDGKMAMAVVPGPEHVVLDRLAGHLGVETAELATEAEFGQLFPGCDLGAMPPFGNLWGIDVFVSPAVAAQSEIAFNAGTHTELIKLAYADFERLVGPVEMALSGRD